MEAEGIAQRDLILGIKGGGAAGVQAVFAEEFRKTAFQYLGLGQLAPLQALPVAAVDFGIIGKHLIGAFAQTEFGETGPDGVLFRLLKIQ